MKLKKMALNQMMSPKLLEMGYLSFKDITSISDGDLFVKNVRINYFLTLGFVISRFYNSRFTASFYLSKTTRWGSYWGDIPNNSYIRIAHFLTYEERELFLDKEFTGKGVVDGWWGVSESDLSNFFAVVQIAESRILEKEDLFAAIDNSIEVKELADYSAAVLNSINEISDSELEYIYIPDKEIDGVPLNWFKAAEKILKEKGGIVNKNTVLGLGADAWRQQVMNLQHET